MKDFPLFTPSSFAYLAGPYTHPEAEVREARAAIYASTTCALQLLGFSTHSPIVQGHATCHLLPEATQHDHEFWMAQDLPILRACSFVICLLLPGWEESRGLEREMQIVKEEDKVFRFMAYDRKSQEKEVAAAMEHFDLTSDTKNYRPWPDLQAFHEIAHLKAPTL